MLAWNKKTGTAWAIECKRRLLDRTISEIGERLAEYKTMGTHHKKCTPIRKHLDRVDVLRANLSTVASITKNPCRRHQAESRGRDRQHRTRAVHQDDVDPGGSNLHFPRPRQAVWFVVRRRKPRYANVAMDGKRPLRRTTDKGAPGRFGSTRGHLRQEDRRQFSAELCQNRTFRSRPQPGLLPHAVTNVSFAPED